MAYHESVIVLPAGEGEHLSWLGHRLTYLATSEATGKSYVLSRESLAPGEGPPAHIQYREDEAFFVLNGELAFTAGNQTHVLRANDFIHICNQTPHFHKNTGERPAEFLRLCFPGGFDLFQFESGIRLTDAEDRVEPATRAGIEQVLAIAPKYGIQMDVDAEAMKSEPHLRIARAGEGATIAAAGDYYTLLIGGEETGQAYSLTDAYVPPGSGPPPHVHSREAEAFYVLEGNVTFTVGGESTTLGAGGFVHLPREIPHAFKNASNAPVRMLILTAPAGFEKFIAAIGRPVTDRSLPPPPMTPQDVEKLMAIAPEFGITMLI